MIILDTTTKKLQVLMAGAVTTTNPDYVVHFVDVTTTAFTPGNSNGTLNGTTAVDVVAAPASSTYRQIKALSITNIDTVVNTITVRYNDNGTSRKVIVAAIGIGYSLNFEETNGWYVLDASGALQSSGGGGSSYSDEQAQDAIGIILTDTSTIDFTYDDATPTITADVIDGSITTTKLGGDITAAGKALLDDAAASNQRTTLGLGTIATQNSNSVTITGGSISGITDLAVADGGTGASDASGARTNLGLVIGTNVQAYDAELAALAGLTSAADKGIQFTGSGTAGTYDLTTAGKALLDDADAATQRTTLGVGTGDSPQFTAVNIGNASDTTVTRTGAGDIAVEGNALYRAGGTDVPVADGGTGLSSTTAYAVLCGGTTSTAALQSIASVGSSGNVLTSNGAGALPTFQAATGGAAAGQVIQVVQGTLTSIATISTTSMTDTGVTATITPASSSNKILVIATVTMSSDSSPGVFTRLLRGASNILIGDSAGSRIQVTSGTYTGSGTAEVQSVSHVYLDSPATTSATTYKIQAAASTTGSVYINRERTDTNNATTARYASSIILMEVKG